MARLESYKSDYKSHHLGCVVTYKKKIIATGHNSNKSHPAQEIYNKYRHFHNTGGYINHSQHAECHALHSIPYTTGKTISELDDWNKVSIYVYREKKTTDTGYGLAKPCPACMNMIKDMNIQNVYFTDDDGLAYLRLEHE